MFQKLRTLFFWNPTGNSVSGRIVLLALVSKFVRILDVGVRRNDGSRMTAYLEERQRELTGANLALADERLTTIAAGSRRTYASIASGRPGPVLVASLTPTEQPTLYPVVALFVDVSDPDGLERELCFRNPSLRKQLHSVKPVYRRPGGNVGHMRINLKSRKARDAMLASGRVYVRGRSYRVVPFDAGREVPRCFRCQKYDHIQPTCRATAPSCGKCAGNHRTRKCAAPETEAKCANCGGGHQVTENVQIR